MRLNLVRDSSFSELSVEVGSTGGSSQRLSSSPEIETSALEQDDEALAGEEVPGVRTKVSKWTSCRTLICGLALDLDSRLRRDIDWNRDLSHFLFGDLGRIISD